MRTYQPGISWLSQLTLKGTFPVIHRDLAVVIYKHETSSALYYLMTSVEDDLVPPTEKCVRAHLHVAGWRIRQDPNRQDRLHLTYIVRLDVRGALPHTLIHALMQNMAGYVSTVGRYISRFGYPTHMYFPSQSFEKKDLDGNHLSLGYGSARSVVRVLAESFEHRGAVYDLVFRVEARAPPPILSTKQEEDHSVWDVEVRCCKKMYPEGVHVEVRTRGNATWWIVEEESASSEERIIVKPDSITHEDESVLPTSPESEDETDLLKRHKKSPSEPVSLDEKNTRNIFTSADDTMPDILDRERRERRKKNRISSAAVISPLLSNRENALIPPPILPDVVETLLENHRVSWHPGVDVGIIEESESDDDADDKIIQKLSAYVKPKATARPMRAYSRTLRPDEEAFVLKLGSDVNRIKVDASETSLSSSEELAKLKLDALPKSNDSPSSAVDKSGPFIRESLAWLVRIRMMTASAGAHAVQVCVRRKEDDARNVGARRGSIYDPLSWRQLVQAQ